MPSASPMKHGFVLYLLGLLASGAAAQTTQQDFIPVLAPRKLRIDKAPAERVAIEGFSTYKPSVVKLPNGELLLANFRGYWDESGRYLEDIFLFRSWDGGKTWSAGQNAGLLGREPYLTVLSDGTLLMTTHFLSDDYRNAEGFTYSHLYRSTDGGRTWLARRIGPEGFPERAITLTSRNVLEMPDSSLLMGVDSSGGPAFIWRSYDRGKTWSVQGECDNGGFASIFSFFGESFLWKHKSGALYAVIRADSLEYPIPNRPLSGNLNDSADHMILYVSRDEGRTWRKTEDFGNYGEMYPSLLRLDGGNVLLTYTVRSLHPPLGVRAVLGEETENGLSFDFGRDRLILDAKTPLDRSSGGGFGPTVKLDDGTLLTAYSYAGPAGKIHLETMRWRLLTDPAKAPAPPRGLAAYPDGRGRVKLSWQASPSAGVTSYHLYRGQGGGAVDYSVFAASAPAEASELSLGGLSEGEVYRFGVRAAGAWGEELNTNVAASAAAEAPAERVGAGIELPPAGRKISGDRVTVKAAIAAELLADVGNIEFQFRWAASTAAAWSAIPAASPSHPNPAQRPPFFIHWDVTNLTPGDYEIRAVATDLRGTSDPKAPAKMVTVAPDASESEENISAGSLTKRQAVFSSVEQTVEVGSAGEGGLTAVTLPAGAISSSSATIKVVVNPSGAPEASRGLLSAGQIRQIEIENGQSQLNAAATISLQYRDDDDDGILDGTAIAVEKLAIYSYSAASFSWKMEAASAVDRAAKTVTAQTRHFSLFGLFAPAAAAAELSDVLVYPVPWMPNGGVSDRGKPFSASDPDSGINFDNLPASVKIQVFNVAGEKIWERSGGASAGKVQWDGRDGSGRDAASGGYFSVITDNATGSRITRKIAIIR
ncbi:MAG: hypothetical protein HY921_06040 [Elusimicrobia bacterium]|nr:hypothetical protein [Elusimicrobiota bacterium]